ncbi:hypothetical protein [Streptomyces purpurascens]|uniref:nSTAND1 domain-containing NTPase n=1 Tax=Streptomyces purpurascens TaxID=1924 RepID=UPI003C2E7C7D
MQLEETVAAEPATARTLLALVVALASVPAEDKRLRVLATLRSACLDDLVEPATAHVLSDCAQIVAPLGRTGLLGAIEGPASRVPGLTLDPGLAERIVDDAENEPGHLPMVEFALTELWSLQAGVRLTHSGYEALGGVTGALSTHAEKRVGEVIAEHGEDPVRRLFVQLARPDDGGGFTRRPARLADLPPGQRAAAEALAVRTRFLRITQGDDGAVVADLAHEALTRKWEQLRVWLEESRRFRTWQEQVREQRALWEEEFRDPGRLLRGVALETALSRSRSRPEDVSAVEREFIQRSVRHRRRGLRRWRAGAATVALLLVVSVVLAVQFGRSSAARAEQLRQQASQALAAEAGTLSGQSPSTSLQLSLAALNNADTPAARQAVLDRYLAMRSVVGQRRNAWAGSLSYLVASAGGDTVVSVSNVGDTVVWRDWAIGGFTRSTLDLPVADASALELSDDGCLLAAVVADRVAVRPTGCPGRWRSQVLRLPRGSGAVDSVDNLDFDAEGRLLLAYETSSGRERDASHVVLWDRGQGKPPRARSVPLPGRLGISEARLLPQGQGVVLLTGTPDEDWDQARAWSLDGDRLLRAPVKHAADLLPDGRILVEQLDRPVAVHDAVTGRRVRGLSGSTASGIDMTGCCLVDSAQAEQQEAGTIDLLAFTPWDDGRRYYTTVPTDREAETFHDVQPVVKRVSANRIRVLLPAGSDLLVVEAEPAAGESLRPRGGSTPSVPDRRGRFRLVFTSNRELQLVGRAREFRSVRVPALGTLLQGAVFTSSGRRAVVWDAFGVWSYSVPALKDRVTLVRSTSLGDIVPLAGDRLAVITDAGLEWIDAATGERLADPVRAVRRDCVRVGCSLAAIPKHPDHVSVLADGVLRIRDLSQGRLVGRPLELGARVARGSGRHVVFGPDGRTVALVSASSDTVSLRNVAGGGWLGRRLEEPGVAEIVDFSEQGLLLQDTAGRIRFWDLRSAFSLRLNLPPRGAGGQWHSVEAWRLDEDGVSAVFGGGEQLAVPLDPNRWLRTLCARAHADRDFLQEELREAPAGMETTAPCAAHRKGVAGR